MKAVVFDGELKFDENYMEPERKENEALIKPLLLGVCNTDEEITKGYMGYNGVLGHEFVGVVVDSDDKSLINKRVVGEINLGCNNCPECSNNLQRHCKQRSTFGIYKKTAALANYSRFQIPICLLCLIMLMIKRPFLWNLWLQLMKFLNKFKLNRKIKLQF